MSFFRRGLGEVSVGWLAAGVGASLCSLGWSWLSLRFEFGQGHETRPILEFLLVYALAWVCFAGGYLLLRRSRGRGPLGWILLVALLCRALLIPSQLIQENDVYRYVLDGQVVRWGGNPYHYSPLVVADLAPPPLRGELARPEARMVLSRIGYPEIPTVYPPAAQLAFALGALLGGWDWMGQRWVFLAIDLAILGLLLILLAGLGMSRSWVLLYAWNPLVLKESINSVHLDGLVGLWLLLAVAGLLARERSRTWAWVLFAGMAAGLAVLTKIYPLVLLPAFVLFLRRRPGGGWGEAGGFLGACLLTVALGLAPFVGVGWDRLTEGIGIYASRWTMNEGAFGLLGFATSEPRSAAAALIAVLALGIPWKGRGRTLAAAVGDVQWVMLLWFLLIPSPFPWYSVPFLALLPLVSGGPFPLGVGVGLTGLLGLYYLSFFYSYHDLGSIWWGFTRALEHGGIWFLLIHSVIFPTGGGLKTDPP